MHKYVSKQNTDKMQYLWSKWNQTRTSADAEQRSYAPQIRSTTLEKACNRRMTFKDTRSHYNCCY